LSEKFQLIVAGGKGRRHRSTVEIDEVLPACLCRPTGSRDIARTIQEGILTNEGSVLWVSEDANERLKSIAFANERCLCAPLGNHDHQTLLPRFGP
jgi:hypothetical protein